MRKFLIGAALVLGCAAHAGTGLAPLSSTPWGGGFSAALAMVQDPLDPTTMYVVQQGGLVKIVKNGVQLATNFADFTSGLNGMNLLSTGSERGLLGMAFSPNFANDRRVFFNYTTNGVAPPNPPGASSPPFGATVISRFTVPVPATPGDPLAITPASRFDLNFGADLGNPSTRWISQPFSNHNGGTINFGPDGYLYIGMGDGGSGGDPGNRAQNPLEQLGKMLRIDVGVDDANLDGCAIPASNPFVAANLPPGFAFAAGYTGPARTQIWAFGVRNPWKHSFDDSWPGRTDAYIIADVGQNTIEEVDWQPAGVGGINWGWRRFEGANLFSAGTVLSYDLGPTSPYRNQLPVHTYTHSAGFSISGGYMYRGQAMCSYKGRYFFADLNGRIWSMRLDGGVMSDLVEHTATLGQATVVGFGRDAVGELYVIRQSSIAKLISADTPMPGDCDGDRDVDFGDLNLVLGNFGLTGPAGARALPGDINFDGVVNFSDLNLVLAFFGANCL